MMASFTLPTSDSRRTSAQPAPQRLVRGLIPIRISTAHFRKSPRVLWRQWRKPRLTRCFANVNGTKPLRQSGWGFPTRLYSTRSIPTGWTSRLLHLHVHFHLGLRRDLDCFTSRDVVFHRFWLRPLKVPSVLHSDHRIFP